MISKRNTSNALIALCALGVILSAACGGNFKQKTPEGFVELEDQRSYDYRAVSADGVVYAIREIVELPKGDNDFWVKAVENKLRYQSGYALLGKEAIKTDAGLAGTQLRFGFDKAKTPHLYNVTILGEGERIFVIESGGTKALMEAKSEELALALKSFKAY